MARLSTRPMRTSRAMPSARWQRAMADSSRRSPSAPIAVRSGAPTMAWPGCRWVGSSLPTPSSVASTWDENGLLAIGTDMVTGQPHGRIWASPDGVTWDEVANLGQGDGLDLSRGPDGFLATSVSEAGVPAIWRSSDGVSWVEEAPPTTSVTPSPIPQALLKVDDAIRRGRQPRRHGRRRDDGRVAWGAHAMIDDATMREAPRGGVERRPTEESIRAADRPAPAT